MQIAQKVYKAQHGDPLVGENHEKKAMDMKSGLGAKRFITRDAMLKSGLYRPMPRKPKMYDYA